MKKKVVLVAMLLLSLSLLSFGCAKKNTAPAQGNDWESQEQDRLAKERALQEKLGQLAGELGQVIHFAFDRYDLNPEARQILTRKAEILKQNPTVKLVIEGHTDEVGTAEYNLALGERRARAAADYLANLGVNAANLSTVSYGKERPVDPGNSPAAHAANRRDEFRPSY